LKFYNNEKLISASAVKVRQETFYVALVFW